MAFHSISTTPFHDSKRSYSGQVDSGDTYSRISMWTKGDETKISNDDSVQNGIVATSTPYKRMRVVDESLLSPEEANILLEKRAYNRDSAKRARYRRKQLVVDLNNKIRELEEDKVELRRSLKQMKKIIETLKAQNQQILINMSELRASTSLRLGSMGRAKLFTAIPNAPIDLAKSFHQLPFAGAVVAAAASASMNPSASSLSESLEYFKYLHNI